MILPVPSRSCQAPAGVLLPHESGLRGIHASPKAIRGMWLVIWLRLLHGVAVATLGSHIMKSDLFTNLPDKKR